MRKLRRRKLFLGFTQTVPKFYAKQPDNLWDFAEVYGVGLRQGEWLQTLENTAFLGLSNKLHFLSV